MVGALLWALVLAVAGPSAAQESAIRSSVLVIDPERLFTETEFGATLTEALEEASRELALENREIEATLIDEERALTSARASMTLDAFREAAEEFDARVTRLRSAQDSKSEALIAQRDQERQKFLDLVLPVLGGLLADYGAFVFLDPRQVFLSDDRINVTDEAISRIDAAFVPRTGEEGGQTGAEIGAEIGEVTGNAPAPENKPQAPGDTQVPDAPQ